jgi:phage terminase small subunit
MKNNQSVSQFKTNSNPDLTPKQEEILQALVTGMNQTDAAKRVGVSREYVCRLCQQDHFLHEIDRRVQRMKVLLAPRALANVTRMAEAAKSERVRLDANLGILDRSGHAREDKNVMQVQHGEISINIDLS